MPVSALFGVVLLVAGGALVTVSLLGWRQRLPRNRFAGVRTPATLRSDAAFIAANRVAAPPVLAAGAVCTAGGALAFATGGPALAVIVGVTGFGTVGLLIAGGLLGHRVAAAVPPPEASCSGCACGAGGCCGADADGAGPGAGVKNQL
ncbi:MAG TPA: SdpI family protein [Pseudonocardiaceae bacterium]|nr:SdpI family protein [Pseudonocardiaceae bacterium]